RRHPIKTPELRWRGAPGGEALFPAKPFPPSLFRPSLSSWSRVGDLHDHRLRFGEEIAAEAAPLPPDPRVADAAERGAQVSDEEAVEPDRPRAERSRDPVRAVDVLGEEHGVEPVPGGVGGGDGFGFGVEGLDDDDRAEDLFVPVAGGRVDVGEDGRAYGPAVAEPAGQHRAGRVLD